MAISRNFICGQTISSRIGPPSRPDARRGADASYRRRRRRSITPSVSSESARAPFGPPPTEQQPAPSDSSSPPPPPVSTSQLALQPSPSVTLPSSHPSFASTAPL